jgi:molybdopterin/thiamine biosynthesis adenylyltransferase
LSSQNPSEPAILLALAAVEAESISVKESSFETLKVNFVKNTLPLEMSIDGSSLIELPTISITDPQYFWGHPHISPTGVICISDDQGVVFDPENVNTLVNFVITQALELIESYNSLSVQERHILFADELQDYLAVRFPQSTLWINGKIDPTKAHYAEIQEIKKTHALISINGSGPSKSSKHPNIKMDFLETTIDLIPPMNKKPDSSWLNSLVLKNPKLNLSRKKTGALMLRVQNSYGFANLAITYVRDAKTNIAEVNFYPTRELDPDYYSQRGGSELRKSRVAVAGVGAVGSRVAEFLCIAGITDLTLIDSDVFSRDNLYRHVLGMNDAGKVKVTALTEHLNSRFLGLNIKPIKHPVEKYLSELIPDIDFLVLTTGNIVLERLIISRAMREKWPFKIISGWVEPVGLGGHSISMATNEKGCLECLYIIDGSHPGNESRCSFIEPNQKVTKNLKGCSGFLPYSGLDAIKTAQLIVDFVLLNKTGYARWIGPDTSANENDIKTSDTYKSAIEKQSKMLFTSQEIYESNCPCCNT